MRFAPRSSGQITSAFDSVQIWNHLSKLVYQPFQKVGPRQGRQRHELNSYTLFYMQDPMNHPIFIDMDDVISETTRCYPALVKQAFGIDIDYEAIADFDLSTSFGLTHAQLDHLFQVVHREEVLMGFSPVPGVVETLGRWQDCGYPIAIVTGRPPEAREISLAWLRQCNIPFDSFDICDKYGRHPPSQGPSMTLNELQSRSYTLAVEDSLSMSTFLSTTMKVPTFLFNRPWNQKGPTAPTVTRCGSWDDINLRAALSR